MQILGAMGSTGPCLFTTGSSQEKGCVISDPRAASGFGQVVVRKCRSRVHIRRIHIRLDRVVLESVNELHILVCDNCHQEVMKTSDSLPNYVG
jgi:hypothetical protein